MKKKSVYTFGGIILLVGLSACGKSTKGKITNEWKITSYEDRDVSINSNGDKETTTTFMTESTYTRTTFHEPATGPSYTSEQTGSVRANELIIHKDGTWSSVQDILYAEEENVSLNIIREESGSWSFIGKTKGDDFEKNERVLFNVLHQKNTLFEIQDNVVVADHSTSATFLTGERTNVYTVTESKKKKMELERERSYTVNGTSEHSGNGTEKTVLEEK